MTRFTRGRRNLLDNSYGFGARTCVSAIRARTVARIASLTRAHCADAAARSGEVDAIALARSPGGPFRADSDFFATSAAASGHMIEQGGLSANGIAAGSYIARWSISLVPRETADASITLESMNMRILWSTLLAASLVGCLASDPQDRTGSPEASGASDPAGATADPSLSDDSVATSTEDLTTGDGITPQAFGLSFTITCNGPFRVDLNAAANGVVFAAAGSCKRRNGTLIGPVSKSFPGTGCMADVANCDGALHCGGC